MDYKEKYEQALERAKNLYAGVHKGCKEVIDNIFPELAESEDERMLLTIIRGFESWKGNGNMKFNNTNVDDILAYLEKQKEPQNKSMAHEDSSWSGILNSPLCKDKNLDDIAQEYVEGVKEYNPTPDWNLVHTAVCYGYHLAEQKEQKQETLTEGAKEYTIREDYTSAYYEQKGYSRGYADGKKDAEQKPAEWSEEDEKIRGNLMSLLANMRGDRITEETYQKYYPWLKSLRPSWKPSEEQMEALERASTNEYLSAKQFDILVSLYEHLKQYQHG